jgi:hypothetical protein
MNARAATPESWTTWRFRERSAFIGVLEGRVASAGASPRLPLAIRRGTQGDASRKGILRTFRPSKNHSTKIKRSRTRLQLVLRANWCWDPLLCAGGSAFLMRCLRTPFREETTLLSVRKIPFLEASPRCGCCMTATLPLVTRMFLLGLKGKTLPAALLAR